MSEKLRAAQRQKPRTKAKSKGIPTPSWIVLLRYITISGILFVLFRSFVLQPFNVPSTSMYPTLLIGDLEIATKWNYGYSTASLPYGAPTPTQPRLFGRLPARGDIVVFRWPVSPRETWVKRVIGLPGDTISVSNGVPTIVGLTPTTIQDTGKTITCREDNCEIYIEKLPGGKIHLITLNALHPRNREMPPITVPPGDLFLMGDNRDDSADSRVPQANGGAGLVPISDLEGKITFILLNILFQSQSLTWPQ